MREIQGFLGKSLKFLRLSQAIQPLVDKIFRKLKNTEESGRKKDFRIRFSVEVYQRKMKFNSNRNCRSCIPGCL
ncbi:hypothetical protein CH373_04655 [Leptospira perolatii]|uniref:Uncharacterized protein n=1 Tax=Leptospira perolatii TaxID=2023191 RepID=A0A2M9ZQ54_9LEPT|nr:hypothetical protein CH360_18530 [Leptospira perolatii]PJZ74207.1 hypothetical protein CH373_04655 [Leptospira perolatii]